MVLKKTMKLMLAVVTLVLGVALAPNDVEAAGAGSVTVTFVGAGLDATPVTLVGYQSRIGSTGNKREFTDIQFSRAYDNNSQQLAKLALNDTPLEKIIFTFTRAAGQFLTVTMYKVRLPAVHDHTTPAAEVPVEQITAVALDKVEVSYKPLQRDGSLGAAVLSTWDVSSGRWK